MSMDKTYIDELLRYGRGTKYHIYGLNIGLQNTNIGLNKKRYSKEEMRELIIDYCQ